MMRNVVRSLGECSVSIALVLCGVVFIVVSRQLPAPRFDALGAGAFPFALGWLVVVLGIADIALTLWRTRRGTLASVRQLAIEEHIDAAGLIRAGILLGLTVLYAVSMAFLGLRFAIATTIYLAAAALVFGKPRLRTAPLSIAGLAVFAFTIEYLIKNVAYIDLP